MGFDAKSTGGFVALEGLTAQLGDEGNKHDRVIILAQEAMRLGIDKGPDIVAALVALGFNRQHVGKLLSTLRGNNPARHHWQRDDDGTYRPLDD